MEPLLKVAAEQGAEKAATETEKKTLLGSIRNAKEKQTNDVIKEESSAVLPTLKSFFR